MRILGLVGAQLRDQRPHRLAPVRQLVLALERQLGGGEAGRRIQEIRVVAEHFADRPLRIAHRHVRFAQHDAERAFAERVVALAVEIARQRRGIAPDIGRAAKLAEAERTITSARTRAIALAAPDINLKTLLKGASRD